MDTFTKDLLEIIFQGSQLLIVIIGALWAYFRFFREGPLNPRIEFDLNCQFFGPQQNSWLAAFTFTADNKGNVEHKFIEIRLRVLGIKENEPLTEFEEHPPMVKFKEVLIKGVNIIPSKFRYFFVRPGVNQSINYTTHIPDDIRFIIVRATFKYQKTNELHSAERVFEVKSD